MKIHFDKIFEDFSAMDKIEEIDKEIEELREKKASLLSKTLVKCTSNNHGKGCDKRTQIGKLIYIQTYWYVRPYSCAEGDYWKEGEGQFDCIKCGHRNRLYKRPEIEKLKRNFKEIIKSHDGD